MFSIKAHNMFSIRDYAAAESFFRNTPPSRRKQWEPHQRPLDNARAWHKRIEKNLDGSYGLWLYRTEMIRYYPPGDDGFARVLLTHHDSQSSSMFMYRHGIKYCHQRFVRHDTSERVWVPLHHNEWHDGDRWAADLMVKGDTIDVSRSWHAPVGIRTTSLECKRERREALKPVLYLLDFAVKAADPNEWRPQKFLSPEQARAAVNGNDEAQQLVLQWAISRNTSHMATLKDAFLRALGLTLGDDVKPLPVFPSEELHPGYRGIRSVRSISQ